MRWMLLLSLSATPVAAQQGVLFRFTPSVGQVSTYRVMTTSEMDLPTGSRMSVEQVMYTTQHVLAREGDVSTVEMVIDSVSMTASTGLPGAGASERLAGTRSTVRIDARGRVVEVQSEDSLVQRLAAQFAGQMAGGSPGQVLFAEQRVAPGATWSDTGTTTISMDQGRMEIQRDLTYRFERLESRGRSRVAVISVSGTMRQRMVVGDGGTPAMTSGGTMRGEVTYDLDASRWVDNEMVMVMTTEAAMLPVPLEMTITVRGELVGRD